MSNIYTFSAPTKRPEDKQLVEDIKEHCAKKHLNFSGLVISLLRAYYKEVKKNG